MCFRLYEDSSRPFLNILRTFCERSKKAEDNLDKLRTFNEKYVNTSKYNMDDADFFSIDTTTVPIGY